MKSNDETAPGGLSLTPGQRKRAKKYAVYALIFIIFALCIWLIFSPPEKDKVKAKAARGLNTSVPMPKKRGIVGDKKSAYEQEQLREKQEEKMRSLQDFSSMLGAGGKEASAGDLSLSGAKPKAVADLTRGGSAPSKTSIQSSAAAYMKINRSLGSLYETRAEDPEKKRLARELEESKAKLDEMEARKSGLDDQAAIIEKSYQIASKYMPQLQGLTQQQAPSENRIQDVSSRETVVPVIKADDRTVSSLQQDTGKSGVKKAIPSPHNLGFFTVAAYGQKEHKNTILACVHDDQTVTGGETVRLRLSEMMQAGDVVIAKNSIISGAARIQGERLNISVSSIEYEGMILPVDLTVYDTDGQRGIFIPGTGTVNAAKEIVANMGTNAGTSISLSSDAAGQLAADLTRSALQGTSQFMAKRLREVKVSLKAGYRVFLLPASK